MGKHAPTSYQIGKQNKLESIQRNLTNEITNGSMQRHLPGKQTCTKTLKKKATGCIRRDFLVQKKKKMCATVRIRRDYLTKKKKKKK